MLKLKITLLYIVCVLFATVGMFAFQLTHGAQLKYRYYQTHQNEIKVMMGNDASGDEWVREMATPHFITSYFLLANQTPKFPRLPWVLMVVILTLPIALISQYRNSNDVGAVAAVTIVLGLLLDAAYSCNWYGDLGFHFDSYFPGWMILLQILLQPEILFILVMFIEMLVLSYALRERFKKQRILELRAERSEGPDQSLKSESP